MNKVAEHKVEIRRANKQAFLKHVEEARQLLSWIDKEDNDYEERLTARQLDKMLQDVVWNYKTWLSS